ncbi:MAG: hypothetical protein AAF772_13140, partial [Acidobacteriota bacterium]
MAAQPANGGPILDALHLEILADRLTLDPQDRRDPGGDAALTRRLLERHDYLGERVAREQVDAALRQHGDALDGLRVLGDALVVAKRGRPTVRVRDDVHRLWRLLDRDLAVAAWAAHDPRMPGYGPHCVDYLALTADPVGPAIDDDVADLLAGPLAETHLHLWGSASAGSLWLSMLFGLVTPNELAAALVATLPQRTDPNPRTLRTWWTTWMLEASVLRWRVAAAIVSTTRARGAHHPFQYVGVFARRRRAGDDPQTTARRTARPPASLHIERAATPERRSQLLRYWHRRHRAWLRDVGLRRQGPPEGQGWLPDCPMWFDPRHPLPYRDPLAQAVERALGTELIACTTVGERVLLADALALAHGGGADPQITADAHASLRADLLRYLRIKGLFTRAFIHQPGTRGLERFLRQFRNRSTQPFGLGADSHGSQRDRAWKIALERHQTSVVTLQWLVGTTGYADVLQTPRSSRRPSAPVAAAQRLQDVQSAQLKRKLELRVAPQDGVRMRLFLYARLRGVADAFEALGRVYGHPGQLDALPRLRVGVIYHLGKREDVHPLRYREQAYRTVQMLRQDPALRPFVIGLDAAGDEVGTPPYRLMPAFRKTRRMIARPLWAAQQPQIPIQLGFTYHVGEDFRDLLGGLRHVGVVQSLLNLQPGDRIGHALALGLDPERWYQRHPVTHPRTGQLALALTWA